MYWDHKIYVEMKLLSKHLEDNTINKSELYVYFNDGGLLSITVLLSDTYEQKQDIEMGSIFCGQQWEAGIIKVL